jgi:hypothetical protein
VLALPVVAAILLAGTAAVSGKSAPPAEVGAALPGARLQGEGSMRFFGMLIYDAALWSLARVTADDALDVPLALELRYARTLRGRSIAERSIEEMKRVGEFSPAETQSWLEAMTRLFPDVRDGDRITGVHRPGQGAVFFVNGRAAGEIRDEKFARLFFGIWLSPRTSEPALRSALLGERT